MRLLHAERIQPISFEGDTIPPYAILSHTWGADEVSFQDIHSPDAAFKAGYAKIRYACQEAVRIGLEYVWVDTCCIDKTSSAELSESINSMFRWYKEARICFAYLSDVPDGTDADSPESAFSRSRWFSRGWTLQELLAPRNLRFFSSPWEQLGSKRHLSRQISDITGIGESFIRGEDSLSEASIAKRMSWASCRKTTRTEDLAYCLLGIFGINMPLLYGEAEKAFFRLQEEIMKNSDDQTLFAWEYSTGHGSGATFGPFAGHPSCFKQSGDYIPDELNESRTSYAITNKGLQINLPIIKLPENWFLVAALACRSEHQFHSIVAIPIGFRTQDSVIRWGDICIIRRDEVTYAPIRSVRFRIGTVGSSLGWTGHPSLVIRNLPRNKSRWTILKVEPGEIWDPEQRVIRLSEDDKRHIVIRLWESEGKGFAIALSTRYMQDMLSLVFLESNDQPLSYNALAFGNLNGPMDRISDNIRLTFGQQKIRMSTDLVIRTLDIEVKSDIELETVQVD